MKSRKFMMAVIGAGPCGIAATIQLTRSGVETVLLEKSTVGGLLHNANLVENYPGFPRGIAGPALCALMERQLRAVSVVPEFDEVVALETDSAGYSLHMRSGNAIEARAVLVATGTRADSGFYSWERALAGKKLFYEVQQALSDAKGRRAAIVGGGDAAYDYALNLAAKGFTVHLIQRSAPRCLDLLKDRAASEKAIHVHENTRVASVVEAGDILKISLSTPPRADLHADFMIIACGRSPEDVLIRQLVSVPTDPRSAALPSGLYLGGDLVRGDSRQAGIAVGDGLAAAMDAVRYLANDPVE